MELTPPELLQAAITGVVRQAKALAANRPDANGFDGNNGWQIHIEGACGEMAVAKHLNRYWSASIDQFKSGGDVGRLQVRTRSKHEYDLIVRADDRDEDVFVLVTGQAPKYSIHGWISGREAKMPEFAKNYGGRPSAFFVPKDRLWGLELLMNTGDFSETD